MFLTSTLCAVLALAAALFCRMLGVFLLLPLAALLVADLPDGSLIAAGLVLGGYGLTQALMQIPTGLLADRLGKKPVLLAALALFAAGGFAAAAAESVGGIIAGRLLQGAGAVAAVSAAWITDIAAPGQRAPALAAFGAVIALAFVTSLLLAPLAGATLELDGVFLLSGWLGLASLLLVLPVPAPPLQATHAATGVRRLLNNRPLLIISGGGFILHYALAGVFFLLPPQLSLPPDEHWQIYGGGFLLALPPALWLIMRVEKNPARWCALAAMLMLAGVLLLPFAAALPAALAMLFLFFTGFCALEAAIPALAARTADRHRIGKGGAMGVVMTCEFAGVFCGGAATGLVSQLISGKIAVGLVCLLLAIWIIVMRLQPDFNATKVEVRTVATGDQM